MSEDPERLMTAFHLPGPFGQHTRSDTGSWRHARSPRCDSHFVFLFLPVSSEGKAPDLHSEHQLCRKSCFFSQGLARPDGKMVVVSEGVGWRWEGGQEKKRTWECAVWGCRLRLISCGSINKKHCFTLLSLLLLCIFLRRNWGWIPECIFTPADQSTVLKKEALSGPLYS